MLKALRSFFESLAPSSRPDFEATDPRVAAAALLVHAVAVDGVVSERERRVLLDVLGRRFSLGEADAAALLDEAKARDDEAVDLYGFTSRMKRELDQDGRRRVVEMLWEVVYADGTVHEFEDNLVWRVAELLGVSREDRIAKKRAAAENRSVGDGDTG